MPSVFDVLGIGCAAVDDILYVESFPAADEKTRVVRKERHCGGLTAVALSAAARLGALCAFGGVLDDDPLSNYVVECLQEEGISLEHMVRRPGARPVHSVIVVDETHHTRNIFFDLSGAVATDEELPAAEAIRSARVLFVDHVGARGAVRAARIAREAGIPVVADIERNDAPEFRELIDLIDHLIVSRDFAERLTGESDPRAAVQALRNPDRAATIVTCGVDGAWFMAPSDAAPLHQPAFRVEVVDTTGCGDVYHGAYAAALAEGKTLAERARFAAAAAALKATQRGGRTGAPNRTTTEAFLTGERR